MTHKIMTLFGAASFLAASPALGAEVEVDFSVPSEGLSVRATLELEGGEGPASVELDAGDGSFYRLDVALNQTPGSATASIYHVKEGMFGRVREVLVDEHTLALQPGEASRVQVAKSWGIRDSATFQVGLTPDQSAFVEE